MKKTIHLIALLLFAAILPCTPRAYVYAKEQTASSAPGTKYQVYTDWLSEEGTGINLASEEEFKDWSVDLVVEGDFEGHISKDGKRFWLSGVWIPENQADITVPETIAGVKVTKVAPFRPLEGNPNLFNCCFDPQTHNIEIQSGRIGKIRSVTLPDTVEEIGDYSFNAVKSLEKLSMPKSLKRIGQSVFSYAQKIKEITFGKNLESIYTNSFAEAEGLEKVKIDKNNRKFSVVKNTICSKDGKTLYASFGSGKKSITIGKKVLKIADPQNPKRLNYLKEAAYGRKVNVSKKNRIYGKKSHCIYVKKTGELLYYDKNGGDPVLPGEVKKMTRRTGFISVYMEKFTVSKSMKALDCRYLPFAASYLGKVYLDTIVVPGRHKMTIKNKNYLSRSHKVTLVVHKSLKKWYEKQFKKYKKVQVKIL